MKNLNKEKIRKFIQSLRDRGVAEKTIKQKLASVKLFINWAHERELIDKKAFIEIQNEIKKQTQFNLKRFFSSLLRRKKSPVSATLVPKPYSLTPKLGFQQYIALIIVLIFTGVLGAGVYNQFFAKVQSPFAYPTALTKGGKILSFQGRMTDSLGNPITTATNVVFKLYNVSSGGTALYNTGTCSKTPDQDGIFNSLIGSDCGSEIDNSVFTENANVYLGITVGSDSEMTPRQQIANVGYAINAETLQGYPPGTGSSNIPYLNSDGNMLIATANPDIASTYASNTFTISSANAATIQSAGTGDILLQATESGTLVFRTGGATSTENRATVDTNGINVINQGDLRLNEGTAGGTNYAGFQAPTTLGGDTLYTLPTAFPGAATGYYLTSSDTGTMSWSNSITASALKWNALTNPDGNLSLAMGANTTTFAWDSLTTGTGLTLSSTSLSSGTLASLSINGTAAASNTQKVLSIGTAGANATSTQTTYGLYATNTHTGTSSTNVGGYFSASGGTNNYAGIFENGNVGIGTTGPAYLLDVYSSSASVNPVIQVNSANTGRGAEVLLRNTGSGGPQLEIWSVGTTFGGSGYFGTGTFSDKTIIASSNGAGLEIGTRDASYLLFGTNNAERVRIDSTGNVGIGTTSPTALLDIAGNASSSGTLAFRGTTDPKINILNGENFGIQTSVGGDVGLGEKFTVLNTGNIGVGDTTPAALFTVGSGDLFQVDSSGNTSIDNQGDLRLLEGDAGGSNYVGLQAPATLAGDNVYTLPSAFPASATGYYLTSSDTGTMSWSNTITASSLKWNALTAPDGNLSLAMGAYTTTWAWDSLTTGTGLTASSSSLSSGTLASLSVNSTAAASNTQKALSIGTAGANATTTQTTYGLYATNTHTGTSSTNVGGYFSASGGTNNYAGIFENGNVGIGTTNPVYSLNIYKAADTTAMLHNSTTGVTQSDGALWQMSGSDVYFWNYEATGKMFLGTNASSKVTIDSSGNVGIGTTSPTALLDVAGNASSSGTLAFRGTTDPKINVLNGENFGIQTSVGGDVGLGERFTVLNSGNVGIGDTTPASLFTVGSGDLFQVDSNGDVTVGGGNINTGNIAFVVGDATTDSVTFTTDGTGNGEIVLPNDAVGPNEVFTTGQTDEYCLTYELTGTTWEWQSCGGGSSAWSSLTAPTTDLTLSMAAYNSTFNWDPGPDAAETNFTLSTQGEDTTGTGDQDQVLLALSQTANGVNVDQAADALLTLANNDADDPVVNAIRFDAGAAGTDFTYGINFDAASIGTGEILLQNGEMIDNLVDGTIALTGNADISGTLFAGTADAFQVSATGAITAVTDETINGIDISTGVVSDVNSLTLNANGNITFTVGNGSLIMNSNISNASDNVIDLNPGYAGGASDALTYTIIDIGAFSPTNATGTDAVNGLAIGNLTDPGASITSTAVNLGSGWDTLIGGTTAGTNILSFTNVTLTTAGSLTLGSNIDVAGTILAGTSDAFSVDASGNTSIDNQGDIRLLEGDAGGSNYVGLQAPATLAGDNIYTLPSAFPASATGYYLTSSDTGTMSWSNSITASALKWNALTNPDGNLSLAMGANTTTFAWDSLTTGTGLTLSSTSLSSGTLASLSINGTAAASNTQKVLSIGTAGANATSTQTTYGLYATNTHTGTSSTNVGGYFSASGGTNNYAGIFENGNVGIGTASPSRKLHVYDGGGSTNTIFRLENASGGQFSFLEYVNGGGATIQAGVNSSEQYYISNGSTDFLNITSTGKVGIGTTSPTSKLHVTGAVTGKALAIFDETGDQNILTASASGTTVFNLTRSGTLEALDGSVSTPAYSFVNDTNTGMYRIGADNVGFAVAGAGELSLSASALSPVTDSGLDLGTSSSQFADLYLDGGNINLDNATDIDLDDNTTNALTITEGANTYLNINTWNVANIITLDTPETGGTMNFGNSNNARTINIGTGTDADTINIGTGATGADVIAIGGGVGTLSINTGDWDISTTGDLTGIGGITADGAISFTPGSTSDITFTTDADSFFNLAGLTSGSGSALCLDGTNNVVTCTVGSGGISGSGTAGQIAFFDTSSSITSETSGFGWDATNNLLTIVGASGQTTQTTVDISSTAQGITSGKLLNVGLTQSSATGTTVSADIGNLSFSPTYSTAVTTPAISGNVLDISRSVTTNSLFASTLTLSGALASFSDSATQTTGTLTSTADVVQVAQNYTGNSGAALNVTSAGGASGFALRVNDDGTLTDSTPFVVDTSGNVGIGTSGPDAKLDSLATSGEQLRLTYTDGSVYTSFSVNGGGDLSVNSTGGDVILVSNDSLSLSTGTGNFNIVGYSGTSNAASITSSSTTDLNKALNISQTGATTGTDYGLYTANTGAGTTNVGGYFSASGATNNYGLIVENGNVGIGSTSPTALLDIAGTASSSGTIAFRGTTDPKINVLNGENFGIQTSVGGDVGLGERFTVLNSGNVGVGDTTPASLFTVGSGDLFQVDSNGDVTVGGGNINTGNIALVVGDATTDSITFTTDGTGNGEIVLPNDAVGPNEVYTTGQTDEYCLTYEGTGTTWEWQSCAGGTPKWNTLSNPDGDLTLTMAAYNTTFNWDPGADAAETNFSLTTQGEDTTGTGDQDQVLLALSQTANGVNVDEAADALLTLANSDADDPVENAIRFDAGAAGTDFTYGINFDAASIGTAELVLQNAETIDNVTDGTVKITSPTTTLTGNLVVQGTTGLTFNTGAGGQITFANLETIDNDTDGTLNIGATTFKITGGTDVVSDQTSVNLFNATTTTLNIGGALTALNLADAATTKTIDIGGVTSSGTDTVNIATNATAADTIAIGNTNATTATTISGGTINLTTDSTGNAELVVPNDSIGPNEVFTTGQTDEYCLTYEGTGTTWEWQTCASSTPKWNTLSNPDGDLTLTMAAYNTTFNWDPGPDTTEENFALTTQGEDTTGTGDQDQVLLALSQTSNGVNVDEAADALLTFANEDADDPVQNAIRFDTGGAGTDFTYGINFDSATIGTGEILLSNGEMIDNVTDGTVKVTGNFDSTGTTSATYFLDRDNTNYGIDPAGTTNFGGYSLKVTGGALLGYDSGNVGIGTTGPDRKLDVLDASNPQLRLSQADGTVYSEFQTDSSGNLTVNVSGTKTTFSDSVEIAANQNLSLLSGTGVFSQIFTGTTTTASTITANSLTTGDILNLSSTSTGLTSGSLLDLEWTGAGTATGDLFSLNIGSSSSTTGNLFNIKDNSSSLFSTSETVVTSNLPANFTAAGDVSVSYDIIMTNQTASAIKSNGPFTIEAGESFENNDLTLKTYGTGDVVINKNLEIQGTSGLSFTTGAGGDITFANGEKIDNDTDGTLLMTATTTTASGNLVVQGTTGLTFNTGVGGDITFANLEKIDNDTDGTITLTAATTSLSGGLTITGNDLTFGNAEGFDNNTNGTIDVNAGFLNLVTAGADISFANAETINNDTNGNIGIGGQLTITIDADLAAAVDAICGDVTLNGDMAADAPNELISDCSGAPTADYAEIYPTKNGVEFGDIVATSNETVKVKKTNNTTVLENEFVYMSKLEKTNKPYQTNVIGIVSNNYGDFTSTGHGLVNEQDNPFPVALSGRVPVKVSSVSNEIKAGDFLTTSAETGKAMKATQSGYIIGKALENWTPGSGKPTVLVFVSNGFYDTNLALSENGNLSLSQKSDVYYGNLDNKINELSSKIDELIAEMQSLSSQISTSIKTVVIEAENILVKNTLTAKDIVSESISSLSSNVQNLTSNIITVTEKVSSPVVETANLKVTETAEIGSVQTDEIKSEKGDLTVILGSDRADSEGAVPETDLGDKGPLAKLVIKGLEGKTVTTLDAAGNVYTEGDINARSASFSGQIIADSVIASSSSFLASDIENLSSKDASISGKLIAKELHADNLDETLKQVQGDNTVQTSNINEIQALLADIRNQPAPDPNNYQNIDNRSQILDVSEINALKSNIYNLTSNNLTVTGNTNLYNLTVTNSMTAGSILIENDKILSLSWDLNLSALSKINFFDGAVTIAKDGTITTKSELIAEKGIRTDEIKPLTDNGQVTINRLTTNQLTISDKYLEATDSASIIAASDNFERNGLFAPAVETATSSAGLALLPQNSREVIIYNNNVKKDSLIYLTPTSPNSPASPLTVAEKHYDDLKPYFKVVAAGPTIAPLKFNWLIIN